MEEFMFNIRFRTVVIGLAFVFFIVNNVYSDILSISCGNFTAKTPTSVCGTPQMPDAFIAWNEKPGCNNPQKQVTVDIFVSNMRGKMYGPEHIPEGVQLNGNFESHYICFHPNGPTQRSAIVEFDAPIKAVIYHPVSLAASDGDYGLPCTDYGCPVDNYGVDITEDDWIYIEGKTIVLNFLAGGPGDRLRVLTAPNILGGGDIDKWFEEEAE